MATDVERLVVSLEASITKYERAMQRALGQTNQTARRIETRFERMNRGIGAGFAGLQRNIAAAFAGVAATRGATQLLDAATRIENQLKVTGLAGEELEAVYQKLYESAQRNLAPVADLVDLYARLGISSTELGVNQNQMAEFVDRVGLALRVQGASSTEARGALIQLSQAMGEGIFRAQEFNSIIEQAPSIHRAAAAGLEEAGGSVAKLRQIMLEGRLSSRAYFDAFLAGSHILEEQVANAELTVSQGFVRLQNVLIDVAKEMNEGSRVSGVLVEGLEDLGNVITEVADFANASIEPISNFIGVLQSGQSAAVGFANALAQITGLDAIGASAARAVNDLQIPGLVAGSSRAGGVVSGTFELLGATPQDDALARILTGETSPETAPTQITVTAPPRTVSLADYPIPGAIDSGSGSGGRGGGSSQADAYQRAVEQQRERLRQLEMEAVLTRQATVANNDFGYSVERLRTQMELENAAAEAGLAITPQRRAEIDMLADSYALAMANAEALAQAQRLAEQAMDDLGQAGRSALDSIIDGFLEGKDAAEIFNSVLTDLAKNLISIGLNQLTGGLQAGGFNPLGFLGGLLGFASGTANTGGRRGEPRGIVHGQEAVIPLPNGGKVPVEMRMPSMPQADGGQMKIVVGVSADSAGNLTPFVESVVQTGIGRAAPLIVGTSVSQANKSAPAAVAQHQQQRAGSDFRLM